MRSRERNPERRNRKLIPRERTAPRGMFSVEALTAIGIIFVVTGVLIQSSTAYLNARANLMTDRALLFAAEGQLERYRAGAAMDSLPPPGALPLGITLSTTTAPGAGAWAGMTRVTVTARCLGRRKTVHQIAVSCYVEKEPPR